MARTTLTLDDDALAAARKYAERRGQTLGEAVSELVLRGAKREFLTDDIGGFHAVRLAAESPKVTAARVKKLEEELF
jgi:hypothetical protein